MIGTRIRQARLQARMTQKEVAAALENAGIPIKINKLAKFEHDRDMPNALTLLALSRVFNVPPVWLMHEPKLDVVWLGYRKRSKLSVKDCYSIEEYVRDVADLQVELRNKLYPDEDINFPKCISVTNNKEAEDAAEKLRKTWNLNDEPIESLTRTAEENGVIVIEWDRLTGRFDGLSGWCGEGIPVIVTRKDVDADRKRFNLAHELGHLVMQPSENMPVDQIEKLAHRFAGALLVPASVALREVGEHRDKIAFSELGRLKQKHGLSMHGWVFRLRDLQIISPNMASLYWPKISRRGWKKKEPYEYIADEKPAILEQMIYRALDKGVISPYQVLQVLPDFEITDEDGGTGIFPTASDLLSMPKYKRERYLDISFALAKDEEFERFEVIGEEEF